MLKIISLPQVTTNNNNSSIAKWIVMNYLLYKKHESSRSLIEKDGRFTWIPILSGDGNFQVGRVSLSAVMPPILGIRGGGRRKRAPGGGTSKNLAEGFSNRGDTTRHYLAERVQTPPKTITLPFLRGVSSIQSIPSAYHSLDLIENLSSEPEIRLLWFIRFQSRGSSVRFRSIDFQGVRNEKKEEGRGGGEINGKFSTNRVSENIFVPANFLRSRDKNFILSKCTRVYMYVCMYVHIHTGSWNNMVYLQWNDSHLINCFAMLQWNSKSGKLSIFVTNSYCSVSLDPHRYIPRCFEIPVHFPTIRSNP